MKAKANEVEIYYEEYGKGDSIIFLHGWMEDHSMWYPQMVYFSRRHRVILYDQRGHGRSDKPQQNYSIQAMSDDLYAFTEKLNIKRFTLVGHSMGGSVAINFALDHPEKLSKMVLVGTGANSTLSLRIMLWILLHALPYKIFADGSVDFKYYNPSAQNKKDAVDRALRTPKSIAYECYKEIMKCDFRDRVSNIKVPTLIICGDEDTASPLKKSQFLNKKIKNSKLEIIPNSKHMPMLDNPERMNKILTDFFD